MAVGTNYVMDEHVFLADKDDKTDKNSYPHEKVSRYLQLAMSKSYTQLKADHIADHSEYFSRVSLDLGGKYSPDVATDEMLKEYKEGKENRYLEELVDILKEYPEKEYFNLIKKLADKNKSILENFPQQHVMSHRVSSKKDKFNEYETMEEYINET